MITTPFNTSFVEDPFLKKGINPLFHVNNWCYYLSFKQLILLSKFKNFLTFIASFIENKIIMTTIILVMAHSDCASYGLMFMYTLAI